MADLEKNIIISVSTDTSAADQGIDDVKKQLGEVNNQPIDKPFKTLKAQIKEAKIELEKVTAEFGAASKEASAAALKVAELKDEFSEVNARVEAFNPDNKLQALVSVSKGAIGAIQGVSGAMAFLGVESSTATETMAKLQGLMAFSDALNSVDDIKNAFKNFGSVIQSATIFQKGNAAATSLAAGAMKLFGISADVTSTSFRVLKGVLASLGIGLIIAAVTELIPIISNWISNTDEAEAAQRRLEEVVKSLNNELEGQLAAIEYYGKKQLQDAKLRGASVEEQFGITRKAKLEEYNFLVKNEEQKRQLYNQAIKDENTNAEALKTITEEYNKAQEATKKKAREIDLADGDERVRRADELRKKEKEANDKADAEAKKRTAERKAAFDKAIAERKQALEEIAKLNAEAQKKINESGLSDLGKELVELQYGFDEKKKKFQKYGQDVSIITKEYNLAKAAIEKKYSDEAVQFILEQSGTEYEIQKAEINKKYEEQIRNATQFADQLIALRDTKLKELDDKKAQEDAQKGANSVAIKAETTLINTQVDNRILDTDSPETRKAKLQAINQAEIDVENAQYQAKLISLKGNQDEIEKATAEHNAKLKDMEYQLQQDRQAIDEATLHFKLDSLNTIGNAIGSLGNLFEKGTVASKAAALAEIAIGTGTGFINALDIAQKSAKATGPAAAFAFPVFYATQLAAVLGAASKAKNILSTVKGGNGGASTSAPVPPSTAPSINSTVFANQNQVQDVRLTNPQSIAVKAYVAPRDLQEADDKQKFMDKMSTL